ncbi:transcription activator of gluconeogenesis ERT1 [Acrasis kona]|uniref:Transcription activator of gluconeogenesis ERT1 n=1 Tax=Acrasis kona TaxID=1008807 RepID=A0AAW2ZSU9_9EUKA
MDEQDEDLPPVTDGGMMIQLPNHIIEVASTNGFVNVLEWNTDCISIPTKNIIHIVQQLSNKTTLITNDANHNHDEPYNEFMKENCIADKLIHSRQNELANFRQCIQVNGHAGRKHMITLTDDSELVMYQSPPKFFESKWKEVFDMGALTSSFQSEFLNIQKKRKTGFDPSSFVTIRSSVVDADDYQKWKEEFAIPTYNQHVTDQESSHPSAYQATMQAYPQQFQQFAHHPIEHDLQINQSHGTSHHVCAPCSKAKVKCDKKRPCANCIKKNCRSECIDVKKKKSDEKKSNAAPAQRTNSYQSKKRWLHDRSISDVQDLKRLLLINSITCMDWLSLPNGICYLVIGNKIGCISTYQFAHHQHADWNFPQLVNYFEAHPDDQIKSIKAICHLDKLILMSGGGDGGIRFWSSDDHLRWNPMDWLNGELDDLYNCQFIKHSFMPNSNWVIVAFACGFVIRVIAFDLTNQRMEWKQQINHHGDVVTGIAIMNFESSSSSGECALWIFSCGMDGEFLLTVLEQGTIKNFVIIEKNHLLPIWGCAVSPNQCFIAIAREKPELLDSRGDFEARARRRVYLLPIVDLVTHKGQALVQDRIKYIETLINSCSLRVCCKQDVVKLLTLVEYKELIVYVDRVLNIETNASFRILYPVLVRLYDENPKNAQIESFLYRCKFALMVEQAKSYLRVSDEQSEQNAIFRRFINKIFTQEETAVDVIPNESCTFCGESVSFCISKDKDMMVGECSKKHTSTRDVTSWKILSSLKCSTCMCCAAKAEVSMAGTTCPLCGDILTLKY